MKVTGLYLLFVVSLAGMILCDDPFNDEEKNQFLNRIFELHNNKRSKFNLQPLKRSDIMNTDAYNILYKKLTENIDTDPKEYSLNYYLGKYDMNTKLDNELADEVFNEWQSVGNDSNQFRRRSKRLAAYQIVWKDTKEIGLAIERHNVYPYYAVIVLYSPCISFEPFIIGESSSDDSKPPTYDQGGSSTI